MAENTAFAARYGRWLLVAGASEGLGAAYAEELAARGLELILVASRKPYVIPGRMNRIASFVMRHLLPRESGLRGWGEF